MIISIILRVYFQGERELIAVWTLRAHVVHLKVTPSF